MSAVVNELASDPGITVGELVYLAGFLANSCKKTRENKSMQRCDPDPVEASKQTAGMEAGGLDKCCAGFGGFNLPLQPGLTR